MIELYYWPTPNGHKVTMLLEELGADYRIIPIDITSGAQFEPGFLKIAPNNRMPAIVDTAPADKGAPMTLFESAAIMEYLADKHGRFLPPAPRERYKVIQWLYWQMSGVGPMFGQAFHFTKYAPEPIDYAINRYSREVERLTGVLDEQLSQRAFIADEYSIADMAIYPWMLALDKLGVTAQTDFPHVAAWRQRIGERPATRRAYDKAQGLPAPAAPSEESRRVLFNQGRRGKPG